MKNYQDYFLETDDVGNRTLSVNLLDLGEMKIKIFGNKQLKLAQVGNKLISLYPNNFGQTSEKLFRQTNVSGYDVWTLFSSNNFQNPMYEADIKLLGEKGWWREIFRDKITDIGPPDHNGRCRITYVSNAETPEEREHRVLAPYRGIVVPTIAVPTADGLFYPGTLIPFETVDSYEKAQKRFGKDMNTRNMPLFRQPDALRECLVCRLCHYDELGDDGSFDKFFEIETLEYGIKDERIGSRPTIKIAMRV